MHGFFIDDKRSRSALVFETLHQAIYDGSMYAGLQAELYMYLSDDLQSQLRRRYISVFRAKIVIVKFKCHMSRLFDM